MAKITIYIDNVAHQVTDDNNLLAAVLAEKINLPYFCWHPSMGAVGACRQCAVTQYQDQQDQRGRLVMSCMTPVVDGMRISLKDPASSEFREQVIAAMMTNHPHDCPVCAEGGECHLQDMTVMTGHSVRHFQGKKRTFSNQNLGPLVGHEMNRCITCYRCVRFYKDYAGGKDFGVFGSKNQVYFGRQTDGTLQSAFSGNLVEVCPTGVFTNKPFSKHYSRKWDLQSAPSVCAHCAVGCNTSIGERYGSVRRVMNRYNPQLNGYFLCDRGRYGLGFVNGPQRLKHVKGIEPSSPLRVSSLDVAKTLAHVRQQKFIGIGSARASLEANSLLKLLVGAKRFSLGYDDAMMALQVQHVSLLAQYPAPTLQQVEQCDFVLVIADDVSQRSPRLALAVRQALRNASFAKAQSIGVKPWMDAAVRTYAGDSLSPYYSLQSGSTELDELAKCALMLTPSQIFHCLQVINTILMDVNADTLMSTSLLIACQQNALFAALEQTEQIFISDCLTDMQRAQRPLLITGTAGDNAAILEQISQFMTQIERVRSTAGESPLEPCQLMVMPSECNSVGAMSLLDPHTLSVQQIIQALEQQQADGVILLEQQAEGFSAIDKQKLRSAAKTLIVLDHSEHTLALDADIVLPVATVAESTGHYANYQGLVQKFSAVHAPELPILASWQWLQLLAQSFLPGQWPTMAHNRQLLAFLAEQNVPWAKTWCQQKQNLVLLTKPVAQQTSRASGRTSMTANQSVHEAKTTQSCEPNFSFSMEGCTAKNTPDMPFSWAPGWNSNQSIIKYQQQLNGALRQNSADEHCYLDWSEHQPMLSELSTKFPHLMPSQLDTQLHFVATTPWPMVDWQARFNAEFSLLYQGDQLELSPTLANSIGLEQGDFASVRLSEQQVVAQVRLNAALPINLITGFVFQWPSLTQTTDVELKPASAAQIAEYQQQLQHITKTAQQQQQQVLSALKQKDQHVPIRFIAGGLDDA